MHVVKSQKKNSTWLTTLNAISFVSDNREKPFIKSEVHLSKRNAFRSNKGTWNLSDFLFSERLKIREKNMMEWWLCNIISIKLKNTHSFWIFANDWPLIPNFTINQNINFADVVLQISIILFMLYAFTVITKGFFNLKFSNIH